MPDSLDTDAEEIVLLDHDEPERVPCKLSPRLLSDLLRYAQARLATGDGVEQLNVAGLSVPPFIDFYQAGYFPPDYRQVIPPGEVASLAHLDLGSCLCIPAFDGHGSLCDLAFWKLGKSLPEWLGHLTQHQASLFAPRLVHVPGEVMLVDRLETLAARMKKGQKHVFLLRPDIDPVVQLRFLSVGKPGWTIGVDADTDNAVRVACRSVGLGIADEKVSWDWTFISHSKDHHRAVFRTENLTLTSDTPWHQTGLAAVEVRLDDGRCYRDRIDLRQADQLLGFTEIAGETLGISPRAFIEILNSEFHGRLSRIESHGNDKGQGRGHDQVPDQGVRSAPDAPATTVDESPCVLDAWQRDSERLGWIGDTNSKSLCLMALAGLASDTPPWLVLRGSIEQTSLIMGILAEILPGNRMVSLARTSESALAHMGTNGLNGKAMVIENINDLRSSTIALLRTMSSRGSCVLPRITRSREHGRMESTSGQISGPVGLLAASADESPLDEYALVIPLDDSPELSAKMAMHELHRATGKIQDLTGTQRMAVIEGWRCRLFARSPMPVLIPGADRLHFPVSTLRHRAELRWLLGLAKASALLHRGQRAKLDGHLVARDEDIEFAITATRGLIGLGHQDLSTIARWLVGALAARPERKMTLPEMETAKPQWTRSQLRLALHELIKLGLVVHPEGGRGRRAHPYVLAEGIDPDGSAIRLLPSNECSAIKHANISPVDPMAYKEMA